MAFPKKLALFSYFLFLTGIVLWGAVYYLIIFTLIFPLMFFHGNQQWALPVIALSLASLATCFGGLWCIAVSLRWYTEKVIPAKPPDEEER